VGLRTSPSRWTGTVTTLYVRRTDWSRPLAGLVQTNWHVRRTERSKSHKGDAKFGRIERTALRPVTLHKVRKTAASGTKKRKEWRDSGVCTADPGM
jgi:hypothetical protein